jgi:protocatechuate 3,4-dioxygenase beta subunit
MDEAGAPVLERVPGRYGEAPVHAETVTAADGSFALEGLPEGDFTLWAQGERGVELRPQVAAGAEGVELVLGEGMMLEGLVTDASEHPLSEVRLTVLHARHSRFFDARSGADGRFQVGPLPKGDYALVAEKEEWLPEYVSPELVKRRGTVVLYQPGRLVGRVLSEGAPAPGAEVRAKGGDEGEQVTTADAQGRFAFEGMKPRNYALTAEREGRYATGEVQLREMDVTTEEVVLQLGESLYVEGTVRDDTGRPIPEARVGVWRKNDYGQNWTAHTDAEGHYRIGPLLLGPHVFDVMVPRYRHLENEEFELNRETGPVDFTLTPAVSLSGLLVDEEGAPVAGVSVMLSSSEGELAEGTDSSTESEEDGRFVLDAPQAGTWVLSTSDERFVPEKLQVQVPSEGVRWVLRRGARINGLVTDEQGAPFAGVWVTAWKAGERWSHDRSSPADEQGRFSLSGMEAGSYMVEAFITREGVERSVARPVQLRDSEHAEVSLRFESGWNLSGIVVDEAGQPLAEASILVDSPSEELPPWRRNRRGCGNAQPQTHTGRDGRFTLKHLTAETYDFWVYKESYSFVSAKAVGAELVEGNSVRVRSGTKEVRLVLKSQARIRGRLVGPEGAPIQRFELNGRFMSDARGAFSRAIEETGTQELTFDAPGMAQTSRAVKVQEGVDLEVGEVRMEPGRRIEGRVVDAETGAPVAEAQLLFREQSSGEDGKPSGSRILFTREDGLFTLPHVEARPMELRVNHTEYRTAQVALGSGNVSATVRLERGATVQVSVQDAGGQPVDADVQLVRDGDTSWESIMVLKGVGRRRGLEPGTYLAQVRMGGDAPGVFLPQRVSVPAEGQVQLAFVQQKTGATLALRVEGGEEEIEAILSPSLVSLPVSERAITLWVVNGFSPRDEKGVKTFTALPPGRARLLLFVSGPTPRFHLEEVEVPAEGVVERVVHPLWQPLPEK